MGKFLFGFVFIVLGWFLIVNGVPSFIQEKSRLLYSKKMQATILKTWVEHDPEGGYYPRVEYEILLPTGRMKSSQVFPVDFSRNYSNWATQVISRFKEGQRHSVYVDISNPYQKPQSFLLPQVGDHFLEILFGFGIFSIAILIFLEKVSYPVKRKFYFVLTIAWFLVGVIFMGGHFLFHFLFHGEFLTPVMILVSISYVLFLCLILAASLPEAAAHIKKRLQDVAGFGLLGGVIGFFLIVLVCGIFVPDHDKNFIWVDGAFLWGTIGIVVLSCFCGAFSSQRVLSEQIKQKDF